MTGDEVREVLESFDLGRWRLAWDRHLRLVPSLPKLPEIPVSSDATTSPSAVSSSSPESADAAFAREIALAHEVCDDQVAADAATAFMPDVPLPFGGEEPK